MLKRCIMKMNFFVIGQMGRPNFLIWQYYTNFKRTQYGKRIEVDQRNIWNMCSIHKNCDNYKLRIF